MGENDRVLRADEFARTDATTCLSAATQLRNWPWQLGRVTPRLSLATTQLMEALSLALARDPASVPVAVRRAALRLAGALRMSAPAPSIPSCADDPDGQPGQDADQSESPAAALRQVPFTESVKLGRMG